MTSASGSDTTPEVSGTGSPSPRTRLKRLPERGRYDLETVLRLIDEIGIGTIAYATDGPPRMTPTMLWREGESVYWHGSSASHAIRDLSKGIDCSLNVYATDGLVLARSGLHSSVNYRSATAYGRASSITEEAHKLAALEAFMDRYVPGRWADLRPPHANELKSSTVMRMKIAEASAKIRTGPANDDEADYALPIWAGVVPVSTKIGTPEDDPRLRPGTPQPDYLANIRLG